MRKFIFLAVLISSLIAVHANAQLIADIPSEEINISINDFRYTNFNGSDISGFDAVAINEDTESTGFFTYVSERPGLAFLSSAVLPGLGQAANRQWWKTAIFAAVEIGAIAVYFERRAHGRKVEREFWQMADENWSVVQYAQFLQNYSQIDFDITDVLTPEGLAAFQQNGGIEATFIRDIDQGWIDLAALNDLEWQTLYRSTGLPFSHVVPAYNSQQYYELVSKYFQFGPGWIDWNGVITIVDGGVSDMPALWREHARIEEEFNDAFRLSSNMAMLLVANHVFSAFDAFFTSQLRLHRQSLHTSAMLYNGNPALNVRIGF